MSLEIIKEHFIGKRLSCGKVNVKGFGKVIVDFAEIRIHTYYDISSETLKHIEKYHDCVVDIIGINVYRIVPNLVKNYDILYSHDDELRKELSEWFDEHFVSVVKTVLVIQ